MNAKIVRTLIISGALLGASALGMAAAGSPGSSPQGSSSQSRDHSSMMGTPGMMAGCPMMGGANMDPKTAMRMHAEMMSAMSAIMLKYSDQAGTAPSK